MVSVLELVSEEEVYIYVSCTIIEPRREKTGFLHMRKTITQISFAVTEKLISAFFFSLHR